MDEYIKRVIDEIKEYSSQISKCLEKIEIYNKAKESCELENKPFLIIDSKQEPTNSQNKSKILKIKG